MSRPLVETVTVTGEQVREGDVVTTGGIPHQIVEVREFPGKRKRLAFADGNVYVLGRTMTIDVTRVYEPNGPAAGQHDLPQQHP